MRRTGITVLSGAAALVLAACGSGAGGDGGGVSPEVAQQRIERAAHVELAPETVPDDARDEGLKASFSNAATAVKDGQVVALFVLEDAGVADEVSDQVRASAPASAQLIVQDEVMVVYATAGGADRAAAVEKAVEAL